MSKMERDELCREVSIGTKIQPATFIYMHTGIGIHHNYLCAVCREKPAVLNCGSGVLTPCWECRKSGYATIKITGWKRRIISFFVDLK